MISLVEFVGPSRFSHWGPGGQPVGAPHPQACVQIAVVSRDQTRNTMTLMPFLIFERLIETYGIKAGAELIRATGGRQRLEAVTSSYRALEGVQASRSRTTAQVPPHRRARRKTSCPTWARKELAKVRGEAAGYRTRLRNAETKLLGVKSPEEFEAALTEVKQKNAELERSALLGTVAREFDLPEELAGRLRGTTLEELEADAEALQAFALPTAPPALGGGLDPSSGDDDGEVDPHKLARSIRRY